MAAEEIRDERDAELARLTGFWTARYVLQAFTGGLPDIDGGEG